MPKSLRALNDITASVPTGLAPAERTDTLAQVFRTGVYSCRTFGNRRNAAISVKTANKEVKNDITKIRSR